MGEYVLEMNNITKGIPGRKSAGRSNLEKCGPAACML